MDCQDLLTSLIDALQAAEDGLGRELAEERATATPVRAVQLVARTMLMAADENSDELAVLHAYLVDIAVDDLFEHIFGGTHYTPETEALRLQTCKSLRDFLPRLGAALARRDEGEATKLWGGFVKSYLVSVNETNKKL